MRYAKDIRAGGMNTQAIIQNRLKGSPTTTGVTRSHRATEKQIPKNGISAKRIAGIDGLFTRDA
jgi:hypothetical protein